MPDIAAGDLPLQELLREFLPGLLKAFDASTLSDLELRYGELQLSLRRPVAAGSAVAITPTPAVPAADPQAREEEPEGHVVTAQLVGTFYLTAAPGKPPLVQEGDLVEPGQVIGIIEAMKVMNEVESEVGGRVTRIMVQNQQPVEFGQPLMVISPLPAE